MDPGVDVRILETFSPKTWRKNAILFQKIDHDDNFRQFSAKNLAKIAEISDHSIDPRTSATL
jgi:hypothetical protein